MNDLDQGPRERKPVASVIGFVCLVLACSMIVAALSAPLPIQTRVALGVLGVFGGYWGLRFQRLGRGQRP